MSEPVSNAEIEDVLSSIRRLVSGESEAVNSADETQKKPEKPVAKLVLTADFRVADKTKKTPDSFSASNEEQAPDNSESDLCNKAQEAPEDRPECFDGIGDLPEMGAANEDQAPEIENIDSTDGAQPVEHEEPTVEMSLVDKIADLEAAVGNQDGEWEPDGSDFQEDADAEQILTEPVQPWIDSTAQEISPDEETVEYAQSVEDSNLDTEDQTGDDVLDDGSAVIDEDTLRDMVSEIVRQELQGALGERITRNVRKLVRREINRTMTARDFD